MSNDGGKPALYYPYIHIRDEHWLKATLLFFPTVKRIVPDTYTPEDLPSIVKYTEIKGPAGPLLQSVPVISASASDAQTRLLTKLRDHETEIKQKYNRSCAPVTDEYWIHDAKFASELLEFLVERKLAWHSLHSEGYGTRNWYALHPILGSAVMTTIGLSIAKEQGYDIVTPSAEFHEALLVNSDDEIFDALLKDAPLNPNAAIGQIGNELAQRVITLTGVNYRALRPEHLPELHASKHFGKFQRLIRARSHQIATDDGPNAYAKQIESEANEIIEAWQATRSDLRKELTDILFQGIALGGKAAKTVLGGSSDLTDIVTLGGAAASLVSKGVRIVQKRQGARPYQYLSEIIEKQDGFLRLTYPLGLES
jgi:hypothetical protein